jgi:hypothetical protein
MLKCLSVLCYICGLSTPKPNQKIISKLIVEKYNQYFEIDIQKNDYVPQVICANCYTQLPAKPMIWRKPNVDQTNCYACLIPSLLGFRWQNRKNVAYPEHPQTNSTRPNWESNSDIQVNSP